MTRIWISFLVMAFLLTACAGQPAATPVPTTTPTPTATSPAPDSGESLAEQGDLFTTADTCIACHTNMVDESGTDVSTGAYWRSTMMANSARDPYWQATLRSEVLKSPDYQAVIEDKCSTCHMPMARTTAAAAGEKGVVFGAGFLDPENISHPLAMDGVSCSLCHQIQPDGFGEKDGFSGGYTIDTDTPSGERSIFGPYEIDEAQAEIMKSVSGFVPGQGLHIEQSEMCATCHTLFTPTISEDGEIVGELPEQTPYLEWLHSEYNDTLSCQSCHMPLALGGVQLSITGGEPRSPFWKHVFVGGNVYMLNVLKTFGSGIGVTATDEQFEATILRTLDQLQSQTARLTVENVDLTAPTLTATVAVANLAGHKVPTGYPARRTWLHATLAARNGDIVFEAGRPNPDGSITGNDQDADPTLYEPHYAVIDNPDEVQIYEAVMHDPDGNVTTTLMRGAGYLKDNRLLPTGFDKETAPADVAVRGTALDDPNFLGGGDRVELVIDLGDTQGPYTLTVELLYQSLSYRWIENLRPLDAPEIGRFFEAHAEVPNEPVLIGSLSTDIGG